MKRRHFLKGLATSAPLMLGGVPLRVLGDAKLSSAFSCDDINDRVLVMIELNGGNDGLNTLIPIEQYSLYKNYRPTVGLNDSGLGAYTNLDETLPLDQQVGIQPDFMAMKDLYDEGKVRMVMDVSYNQINRSHFKGIDIWMAGKDGPTSDQTTSGWIGRYLNDRFPNYPDAFPNPDMPDPLALSLGGNIMPLAFHRQVGLPMGIAMGKKVSTFNNLVSGVGGIMPTSTPNSQYGIELQHIIDVQESMNVYAARLETIYNQGTNSLTYPGSYHTPGPGGNGLSGQLATIARLLSGGSKTKIFLARIGGFDNHSKLAEPGAPHTGGHAVLLYHLSQAIKAFQNDLKALGLEDRVLTLTFSEFGRQVKENGSLGTDHGTTAPMFLIGKGINPGMSGTNPDLTALQQNIFSGWQYDYRQVFTTVLQDWLGAGDRGLQAAQLDPWQNQKLDLINSNYQDPLTGDTLNFVADPSCYDSATGVNFPVEFARFDALLQQDRTVLCSWDTALESNNELFMVERSSDNVIFQKIGEVPGAGRSDSLKSYDFTDGTPLLGRSYYRLKQVDFNGEFSYSDTREVNIEELPDLRISMTAFPNPVNDRLSIRCESNEAMTASFRLCKSTGATVEVKEVHLTQGNNEFSVDVARLSVGLYFAELALEKDGNRIRIGWQKIVKM